MLEQPKLVPAAKKFKVTGRVQVYALPADYTYDDYLRLSERAKEACLIDDGNNLAVNAGLDQICNLLLGINTSSFTHCGVGDDDTAVTPSDTDLISQVGNRNSVTSRYLVSTGQAHFDTFFASGDAAGTWLETGLFTASTSGTMLARRVIATFTKSASNTAVIAWTITFTAVDDS